MVGIRISKSKIVRKNNENHKQERVDQAKAVETKKKTYSEVTEQIRSLQFFMTLHAEVKILYIIYYVCILHIYVSNM